MYIAPNSTIKLLTGVPIDKNQSDTLWFASFANQTAYFNGKAKKTFTEQTYQRLQRGYARLEVSADTIYDCNYMMFQNTSFGSKWFYAFINNVEYINNEVSEIRFTIDPIQTWFFDYTLHQCFIDRCTPITDEIGDNILPEPIALGEYVLNGTYEIIGSHRAGVVNPPNQGDFSSNMGIIVQYINPNNASGGGGAGFSEGSMIGGVYSAAQLYIFGTSNNEITALKTFIEGQAQHFDTIQGIYMIPLIAVGADDEAGMLSLYPDRKVIMPTATTLDCLMTAITKNTQLSGYTPRNAKCYTYPYTFYHVDAPSGESMVCRYEFFVQKRPRFIITLNATYPVEINLFPTSYKNGPDNTSAVGEQEYRPEKLSIQGFPQCSWSMDAYIAWAAQNSVPIVLGGISNTIKGAAGGIAMGDIGMIAGAVGGAFDTVINFEKDYYNASIAADVARGSFTSGSNDVAAERLKFKGGCMTQPYNYIKAVDEFFDAFGYTKRQWGDVNIHARSRWTYVKTSGANVDGGLPADDAKYIADCFDRGIRFWADTVHPCDYSTANGFLT